jgi:APA family basic amino acid/polyamine antiporter
VRVPGYPWTPAVFVAAAALVVASAVHGNPGNAAIGTGLLLLGIPVYLWWRRPGVAPIGGDVEDAERGRG